MSVLKNDNKYVNDNNDIKMHWIFRKKEQTNKNLFIVI